jgi:hypothetical protein
MSASGNFIQCAAWRNGVWRALYVAVAITVGRDPKPAGTRGIQAGDTDGAEFLLIGSWSRQARG